MIISTKGPQSIGQIYKYFVHGNLFLSPEDYQREGVWNQYQKALLIDTIFRGLDIPKLYFWKIDLSTVLDGYPDCPTKVLYKKLLEEKQRNNDDPNPYFFEVVDGQQRIRTILEFMGANAPNSNVYRGTWHPPYNSMSDTPIAKGRKYSELNPEQQIKFEDNPMTVMILENAKIDEVRDMFLRLQNGTPLNAQQKRDAKGSHIGKFARELAKIGFFQKAVDFENSGADFHRVASQMIHLELKEKIISCTSAQLDKLYHQFKTNPLPLNLMAKIKKVICLLGEIFPAKNPSLNRSYAVGLYWIFSRMIDI